MELYYSDLLPRLDAVLKEKRPSLQQKNVISVQSHPPYSPDLDSRDFFLFPTLKQSLAGKRRSSNEEIIAATDCRRKYLRSII